MPYLNNPNLSFQQKLFHQLSLTHSPYSFPTQTPRDKDYYFTHSHYLAILYQVVTGVTRSLI